jgi:hypothetical protein
VVVLFSDVTLYSFILDMTKPEDFIIRYFAEPQIIRPQQLMAEDRHLKGGTNEKQGILNNPGDSNYRGGGN